MYALIHGHEDVSRLRVESKAQVPWCRVLITSMINMARMPVSSRVHVFAARGSKNREWQMTQQTAWLAEARAYVASEGRIRIGRAIQ